MKATKNLFLSALILGTSAMALQSSAAHAGNFFKKAIKVIAAPVTNPIKIATGAAAAAGTIVGGDVGNTTAQAANSAGQAVNQIEDGNLPGVIQHTGEAVVTVGQVYGGVVRQVGSVAGGRDIQRLANSYASVVTLNSDLLGTSIIVSGNVLAGEDPRQIYAAPLAAAIRNARNAHRGASRPIPAAIQEALRDSFPASILNNARFTVGKLEITASNLTNRFQQLLGGENAVTVGDVIVFSRTPSSDPDDENALRWWAHELAHVWQYSGWGIDRFAMKYINNYRAIEQEADTDAEAAVARYADAR